MGLGDTMAISSISKLEDLMKDNEKTHASAGSYLFFFKYLNETRKKHCTQNFEVFLNTMIDFQLIPEKKYIIRTRNDVT